MRTRAFSTRQNPADPRLEAVLRRVLFTGLALVVAVPAARGSSAWLGALPLWLLAMPAVSWWALHRFRLPRMARTPSRRRRRSAQARRRPVAGLSHPLRRAA